MAHAATTMACCRRTRAGTEARFTLWTSNIYVQESGNTREVSVSKSPGITAGIGRSGLRLAREDAAQTQVLRIMAASAPLETSLTSPPTPRRSRCDRIANRGWQLLLHAFDVLSLLTQCPSLCPVAKVHASSAQTPTMLSALRLFMSLVLLLQPANGQHFASKWTGPNGKSDGACVAPGSFGRDLWDSSLQHCHKECANDQACKAYEFQMFRQPRYASQPRCSE
eukprot:6196936-Pleurochrysis_carterae.AAC.3